MAQLLTAAGLDDADYPAWPEAKRLELLTQELRSPRPLAHGLAQLGAEAQDVLDGYRTLASHGEEFGYDGLGSLIVSMTRSVSDLLAVYVLAREAGLVRPTADGLVCRLPVMPLFETVEDLAAAPDILHRFLQHPITERSLPRHHDRPVQQVMLGYSDSAKAAGIFAGQWALYQAQKQLTAVARLFGVTVRFFHGRGGTVSRGAGPTHRFLEALPHGSLAGLFRATEQGETISQKYANLLTAAYNLELLLAGVTATTLRHQRAAPDVDDLDAVMQHLAAHSQQAYQDLLAEPGFLTYFAQATPIDAIEESRIGSRPTRRTGERTLEDLRAIPWVFSWTQSRHYLPGWYGLGYALQQLAREQPAVFERLEQAIPRWPYLRYVLGSIETNLVSADLDIMRQYAGLVGDADVRHRVFHLITHEYLRTRRFLERVLGGNVQTRRPRLWSTVQWRAAGLRALHEMQIRLLSQWRDCLAAADAAGAAALLPRVLLSVNALASGLRTTG
jgi:phosphoenolpyruvate carboxylase